MSSSGVKMGMFLVTVLLLKTLNLAPVLSYQLSTVSGNHGGPRKHTYSKHSVGQASMYLCLRF